MFYWSAQGLVAYACSFTAVAVAALVFLARPQGHQNKLVALILLLDGIMLFAWAGLATTTSEVRLRDPGLAVYWVGVFLMLAAYIWLIGSLRTPLVAWFRYPVARLVVLGLVVAGIGSFQTNRGWYESGGFHYVWLVAMASYLFAAVAALDMWRRAPPGSPSRTKAGWFAAAFIYRDALYFFLLAAVIWGLFGGLWRVVPFYYIWSGTVGVYAILLAYAVLKHQLFDIDLKIKMTLRKSTLVAVFVGAFFVSAQVAQAFLVTEWGWAVGGIVAGLLLLAINPLQRFAGRVADAAMPTVEDTSAYREKRKQEIYAGALEELLADQAISAKERLTLLRLQRDLGMTAAEANRIEEQMITSTGVSPR